MSTRFLDALKTGRVVLMDGAMGTELIRRGLNTEEEKSHHWNATHRAQVQDVHQEYLDAGASCLLTNTFLAHLDFPDSMPYPLGAELAKSIGTAPHFVLLDCGPGSQWYQSLQAIQIAANHSQRCDALLAETQRSVFPLRWLLESDASFPASPLLASFSYSRSSGRLVCSEDGSTPEALAEFFAIHRDRLSGIGVNCGRDMGMDDIIEVVRRYRKVTDLPILARPNAGTPIRMGDRWVHPHSPSSMAAKLPDLIEAGATLIGGCCGTTPAHIAAFRDVIERMGVGWKPG